MISIKHLAFTALSSLMIIQFSSCKKDNSIHDATGTFESTEIIVSSEANGVVLSFKAEEGDALKAQQEVAIIDGENLSLQKDQILASADAISQKQNDAAPQIEVLNQQIKAADTDISTLQTQMAVLKKEQQRVSNLFKAEAATSQQMDDINGKVDVLTKQIQSAESRKSVLSAQIKSAKDAVSIQNRGIGSERKPLEKRAAIIDNQLEKTKVINPTDGTILTKYINEGEFVTIGKPLYKLADLTEMTLRAYITGAQLPLIKNGQNVKVYIDNGSNGYKEYPGMVTWISDKAEFTPKTIQTKDERSNLVYAIKIKVKNDGYLKIGMYGEVGFADQTQAK